MQRCTWNKFFHSETCKKGKNGPIIINCAASWLFHSIQRMSENRIDFCIIVLVFYSKHHAAERWDLEFGSNTTEKFENSLKYFKTHWKIWKLTRFKSFQLGWMVAITTEGEKRLRGVFSVVNFISGVSAVALQSSDWGKCSPSHLLLHLGSFLGQ